MMSEAEVSSSGHPEDGVTTLVNAVVVRAELDQAPTNNAVYVLEATEVKSARGCACLLTESLTAMTPPVELWSAGRVPAANRQGRLDQGQEYQEV